MPSFRSALALPLLLASASGCITTPPPSERALVNTELCTQQINAGDLKQAEVYCDLALEFAPQFADIWVNKGLIALYSGNNAKAKEHFIKAIRFNQEHAAAYMNLGVIYLNEGAYGKAHDNLKRALKVNPDYLEARKNLGLTYINLNKLSEAEKEFLTLLAINPNVAEFHHDLGIVRYRQDRKEEAVEEMTKAVQIAPNQNADWWNDLGAVLNELSRFEEAKMAFSSCVAVNPNHPQCIDNLSIAQRKAALTDSALKEYRDTQKAQNDPAALFQLAQQYKQKGLLSEEERAYKDCVKLDGKFAPCHYGLFQLYSDAHKRPLAEVACKNFIKYGSVEDFPSEMETCEKFISAQSY
ncbi:tetratricopeptide repeat protein [Archangium violaceum]|uniref:tetratricopeptide repeat protein n=1 Tax=Archangium violaceum TaxID=83451 RepID=UPI00194DD73B|nr:tetratricopeptide repeat protein [Archangium violaceum]QRO00427.1 tetratricopeptide repeat protein [Archangium violaceum]